MTPGRSCLLLDAKLSKTEVHHKQEVNIHEWFSQCKSDQV